MIEPNKILTSGKPLVYEPGDCSARAFYQCHPFRLHFSNLSCVTNSQRTMPIVNI